MSTTLSEDSEAQLAKIARGGAVNLLGAVVSSIGGFLLIVIVTNRVDSAIAGSLFSATSIFLILTSISSLGTETGLARFMLRLEARRRHHDIPTIIKWAAVPAGTLACSLSVVLLASASRFAPRLGLGSAAGTSMLRTAVIFVPVAAASDFALALTRAFGRMRPTALVDSIGRVSLQVILMVTISQTTEAGTWLTLAWVAPYAPTSLVAIYVARRILDRRMATWPTTPSRTDPGRMSVDSESADTSSGARSYADTAMRNSRQLGKEFWSYTWARGVARVCQIAIQRLDIIIIAALLDVRKAAIYTAATRFVVLGQFTVNAIQQVLQPRFSQLLANNDLPAIRDVFKVSTSWSMTLSFPIYTATACAAPIYLSIFGKGYEDAGGQVVVVMALAMMFSIAAGPLDTLLLMAGGSVASLLNMITALVVDIGGCIILIPRYGILGAAIAWGLAIVARNTLTFFQIWGQLKLTPWSSAAARVTTASIACFAAPSVLLQVTDSLTFATFFAALLIGSAAYAGLLWIAREQLALSALSALLKRRVAG